MVSSRTVLILGAGASQPYGFPLGSQLRDNVLLSLGCGAKFRDFCETLPELAPLLDEFREDLVTSGFASVDSFLEARSKWMEIGKLAMGAAMLECEYVTRSRLFPPEQPGDHWYEVLWNKMRARSWSAFKKQPLTIVTFNYDRSLEYYLSRVACNNYGLKSRTALSGLPIIHVHGVLGHDLAEYGSHDYLASDAIREAADSIRVVHEAAIEHSAFISAREAIADAELVLFIGLGYLDSNMRKLGFPPQPSTAPADVVGTVVGLTGEHSNRVSAAYGVQAAYGSIAQIVSDRLR